MNKTESNVSETPPVRPSRWLPLLLAIAIFMQMLDATILNTALPEIAKDFQVSPLNMLIGVECRPSNNEIKSEKQCFGQLFLYFQLSWPF